MDYKGGQTAGKNFVFRLLKKHTASTIMDENGNPVVYVGSYSIPNISIIREANKDGVMMQRTIRYISGESSIYKDLQSPDKDVPKKPYRIKFENGRKVVSGDDMLLLEFMMKTNQNSTNPDRRVDIRAKFELVDNAISVSKEIAKDKLISEVTGWCWNSGFDEVKAYARVLNVNQEQSNDEIRHDLKVIALRDPEKFMRELKNPSMRKKHYVLEAVDRGFLIIDPQSNSIAWSNNPYVPVAVAAVGVSVVDVLVQKLSTDEGQLMYSTIVDLLKPEEVVVTKMSVPSPEELKAMKQSKTVVVEPDRPVSESDAELMDIVESGINKKLIVYTPPLWYRYKDENFKKKEGFVEGLKANPGMLKSLKYEINKINEATPA